MKTLAVINEFESWLNSSVNFEKRPQKGIFWLETMDFLCKRFNNPQKSFTSFHVAGSKGKGSVSCYIANILEAAQYKTGMYMSPHVSDLRERVSAPSLFFSDEIYEKTVREFIPRIESIIPDQLPGKREPTWFELLTMFSIICFKNAQCTHAVFETGMGGRLDATNIIEPTLCCLTPIELEHTEYLGDTLEKIAGEKAGIIKKGVPVFSSIQHKSVRKVFTKKAYEMNAPLFFMDDLSIKISLNDFETRAVVSSDVFARDLHFNLAMPGKIQAENALLAAIAVKNQFPTITEQEIETGIACAHLPGRFEKVKTCIKNKPLTVVLDGAHTVNSLSFVLSNFYKQFGNGAHLLFSCAADKNIDAMAQLISRSSAAFSSIMLTRPGEHKKSNYDELLSSFSKHNISCAQKPVPAVLSGNPTFEDAIKTALSAAAFVDKPLLVAGSFYLVGEVKKVIESLTE